MQNMVNGAQLRQSADPGSGPHAALHGGLTGPWNSHQQPCWELCSSCSHQFSQTDVSHALSLSINTNSCFTGRSRAIKGWLITVHHLLRLQHLWIVGFWGACCTFPCAVRTDPCPDRWGSFASSGQIKNNKEAKNPM